LKILENRACFPERLPERRPIPSTQATGEVDMRTFFLMLGLFGLVVAGEIEATDDTLKALR
jgi:hypothetical protein